MNISVTGSRYSFVYREPIPPLLFNYLFTMELKVSCNVSLNRNTPSEDGVCDFCQQNNKPGVTGNRVIEIEEVVTKNIRVPQGDCSLQWVYLKKWWGYGKRVEKYVSNDYTHADVVVEKRKKKSDVYCYICDDCVTQIADKIKKKK